MEKDIELYFEMMFQVDEKRKGNGLQDAFFIECMFDLFQFHDLE